MSRNNLTLFILLWACLSSNIVFAEAAASNINSLETGFDSSPASEALQSKQSSAVPLSSSPTMPAPPPEVPLKISPMSPVSSEAQAIATPKKGKILSGRLAELNLSPEQIRAIIDIRKQSRAELEKRIKEEFDSFKQSLAQGMADATASEEVRQRFEGMQKKYLELQTMKFDKLLKIREVLTPEQRRKFAEIRNKSPVNPDAPKSME